MEKQAWGDPLSSNKFFIYFQEQKWNDLALTSLAPEFGFIDPINTNSV